MNLYRDMDRAALDAAYNNSAAVGLDRREAYVADWRARSAAMRAGHRRAQIDLRYGPGARQVLDWYGAAHDRAPTLMYIHGGYWQGGDKADYGFIAAGPNLRGINVAVVEYTLAPDARMDGIVTEIGAAVAWLAGNLGRLGGDGRLYVSGHSAGGHLTATAMTAPQVRGGLAISGIYDLEPIRLGALNDKLGLDAAEAARNSPIFHLPQTAGPLIVAVGEAELPELLRQSADFHAAWIARGLAAAWLPLPGHDHFSLLGELANAGGRMCLALADLIAADPMA